MFIFSQSFGVISLLSAHLTTLIWDQPWDFFGRNDAKAETPVLWPPQAKSWFLEKTDAGMDWRQDENGTAEDGIAGWHHWLDGRESEWTRSWWWTGRPSVLQFMGSPSVRMDWVTQLNWSEYIFFGDMSVQVLCYLKVFLWFFYSKLFDLVYVIGTFSILRLAFWCLGKKQWDFIGITLDV